MPAELLKQDPASVCHYLGIVFFIGRSNPETPSITLAGNAGWNVEGTIYNPNSTLKLSGNGDWSLTGQVLSKKVISAGNGVISVIFDPSTVYNPDPSISLVQ